VTTTAAKIVKFRKPTAAKPLRAFVSQVAREYRDKFSERLLRKELRKPWMKYREIGIIEELLAALRPMRVLEWGAGYGTLHFARCLPPQALWTAVEHDPDWAERIRALRSDPRVRIHAIQPESEDWGERHPDGAYADFRTYVDFPARFAPYDFILVDGRAREACLRRTHELLSPQGVVVLHDANRTMPRAPGGLFPSEALFRDYRKWSGGIWIGSKGRPVSSLLDVSRHGRIWRMYNSFGKGLHL
jgi:predicted O-methyltransferase YrrM